MYRKLAIDALEVRALLSVAAADTVLDMYPGPLHGEPQLVKAYGDDELVFWANTPDGADLFITDGTVDGTRPFTAWDGYGIHHYRRDGVVATTDTGVFWIPDGGEPELIATPGNGWIDGPGYGLYYTLTKQFEQLSEREVRFTHNYEDGDGRAFSFEEIIPCWLVDVGRYECPTETSSGDFRVEGEDEHGLVVSVAQDVTSGWPRDYYYADAGSPDTWVEIASPWQHRIDVTQQLWLRDELWINTETEGLVHVGDAAIGAIPEEYWRSTDRSELFLTLPDQPQQVYRINDDGTAIEAIFDADTYGFEFPTTLTHVTYDAHNDKLLLTLSDVVYGERSFWLDAEGTLNRMSPYRTVPDDAWRVGDAYYFPAYEGIETGRELTVRRIMAGDANLDGMFNTGDLVALMALGEYEDDLVGNSHHMTGDFNGDGEFDSSDLVEALALGWYEG
jgi:hypothetical protein